MPGRSRTLRSRAYFAYGLQEVPVLNRPVEIGSSIVHVVVVLQSTLGRSEGAFILQSALRKSQAYSYSTSFRLLARKKHSIQAFMRVFLNLVSRNLTYTISF